MIDKFLDFLRSSLPIPVQYRDKTIIISLISVCVVMFGMIVNNFVNAINNFGKGIDYSKVTSASKLYTEGTRAFFTFPDSVCVPEPVNEYFAKNPNTIDDFEGYISKISVEQADKIKAYLSEGKYLESIEQFKKVTGWTDKQAQENIDKFKFPESSSVVSVGKEAFVSNKGQKDKINIQKIDNTSDVDNNKIFGEPSLSELKEKNINAITSLELEQVFHLDSKKAQRFVKYRALIGGFANFQEVSKVYGLTDLELRYMQENLIIGTLNNQAKIDLNSVSVAQLQQIKALSYTEALQIQRLVKKKGKLKNLNELQEIPNFNTQKIQRLALSLYVEEH